MIDLLNQYLEELLGGGYYSSWKSLSKSYVHITSITGEGIS